MGFTCEKCGWWADVNGVCVCGYSGRPTTRHDSCTAWKTSIRTNADRIRAMSDEELAEYLFKRGNCQEYCYGICDIQGECDGSPSDEHCISHIVKWLKKEVKE